MAIYYNPETDMEIISEGPEGPSWVLINEAQARNLGDARKAGGRVYLNASNQPTVFYPPEKPDVQWNETTHLMPFEVVNGVAQQYWAVSTLTYNEQATILATLRYAKQNTGLLYIDPDTQEWQSTLDPSIAGSVYIPTDALTMTTLMGIKGDYDRGINIDRDWKVGNFNFVTFSNEQLSAAYVKGQEYWQTAFTIERKYAAEIAVGRFANIYEWTL